MALLSGSQLRRLFSHLKPFDEKGRLIPQGRRVSILAANANFPLDLQGRAFAAVAAEGSGSPIIIQLSYSVLRTLGEPEDPSPRTPESLHVVRGAAEGSFRIERYVRMYGARLAALSIDHFLVPSFPEALRPAHDRGGADANLPRSGFVPDGDAVFRVSPGGLDGRIAESRIDHVLSYLKEVFGAPPEVGAEELAMYREYLASPRYGRFKREFMNVVAVARPAWAMIDTEHLPPILNFVVTRDIVDTIRYQLGDLDVMLEAEFGATGRSGSSDYELLKGKPLKEFAENVAAFVHYTGADGISYPIGMAHAARKGELHEPDIERLRVVQQMIMNRTGRYVPFTQHGGTGAAELVRGLVAKNNINTFFLVAQASLLEDHISRNVEAIRAGDKAACGIEMYRKTVEGLIDAAREKLIQCGSYQKGDELDQLLNTARE